MVYDRIKVLLFTGGLLMIDIAAAVLVSLIWFLDRYRLGPLANYQAALEYGYRAGLLASESTRTNLHQVVPMPQPRPAPGYTAANGTEHGSKHVR